MRGAHSRPRNHSPPIRAWTSSWDVRRRSVPTPLGPWDTMGEAAWGADPGADLRECVRRAGEVVETLEMQGPRVPRGDQVLQIGNDTKRERGMEKSSKEEDRKRNEGDGRRKHISG